MPATRRKTPRRIMKVRKRAGSQVLRKGSGRILRCWVAQAIRKWLKQYAKGRSHL